MNVRIVLALALPIMVLGIVLTEGLYNECKSDGYSTFACLAMVNKGQYVIVDAVDGRK